MIVGLTHLGVSNRCCYRSVRAEDIDRLNEHLFQSGKHSVEMYKEEGDGKRWKEMGSALYIGSDVLSKETF